jgi:drug/metabolite transporter (DMT)-like permease
MSAFFAITSAFLYGLANVITKIGLRYTNASSAVRISLLCSFIIVFIICVFSTSPYQFMSGAVFYFLAAGVIGPFLGRVFLYKGIDRVGSAVSSTLFEDRPLFAVFAAVFILGERLTSPIGAGLFLMMAGTILISLEKSGGQIDKEWSKRDLIFPLAAGACYGVAQVFRKMGLNVSPTPLVGVMVQNVGAMASIPLLAFTGGRQNEAFSNNKKVWSIFSVVAILQILAQWCLFKALDLGTVVVVSPLSSLSSFFALLLTALFLRKLEKVTWKIVIGAILIVGATLVLTMKT